MSKSSSDIDLDTYDELVRAIYTAATDTSSWPTFINRLMSALNATSGLLRAQDLDTNRVGTYITQGLDPDYQDQYRKHFIQIDPFLPLLDSLDSGEIVQTTSHLPDYFKKSEFYNDYALPQSMDNSAGCALVKNDRKVAILGVHRSERYGYFEKKELALVNRLIPHLQRAFEINSKLLQLNTRSSTVEGTLNYLSTGVILINDKGKCIYFNEQAETFVSEKYVLSYDWKGLKAEQHADTRALWSLIQNACSPPYQGGALSLQQQHSLHGLNILVIPINSENQVDIFGVETTNASAALFIDSPIKQLHLSPGVIGKLFGLTKAEARLSILLANGYSLDEISKHLNLSKNTVRTQLKSCFRKTGVNQQTQLVKLILCAPTSLVNK